MPKKKKPPLVHDHSWFDIDRNQLIEELDRQTRLFGEHAFALAEAKKDLGERAAELEVVQAELGLAIIADPDKYGLTKSDVKTVERAIIVQPEYKKAYYHERRAKSRVEFGQAAVSTITHRKKVIEDQLALLQGEFWSMPKIPQGKRDQVSKARRDKSFGSGRERGKTT